MGRSVRPLATVHGLSGLTSVGREGANFQPFSFLPSSALSCRSSPSQGVPFLAPPLAIGWFGRPLLPPRRTQRPLLPGPWGHSSRGRSSHTSTTGNAPRQAHQPCFQSRIFTVPRPDGRPPRIIIDLSPLNPFILAP